MINRWLVIAFIALASAGCVNSSDKAMSKPEPEKASDLNLEIGMDYFRKGNLAQAKEKIDKSLQQNPRSAKAHAGAALLYDKLGEAGTAEAHYEKSVSLDPKNPELQNNYAVFLCQKGKYERGEKVALQTAANPLYKTPEIAFMNAANCALNAKNMQSAESAFRQALRVRPKFGPALIQLAGLEYQQGNYLSARGFLDRYLEVGRTSAATLSLAMNIEKKMGNTAAAAVYAKRLQNEFPASAETRALTESQRNAG